MDRYVLREESYEEVCLRCRQLEMLIDSLPGVRSDLEAIEHLDDEIGVEVSLTFRVATIAGTDLPYDLLDKLEKLTDEIRRVTDREQNL